MFVRRSALTTERTCGRLARSCAPMSCPLVWVGLRWPREWTNVRLLFGPAPSESMIGIASARAGAGLALTKASSCGMLPPADCGARDYHCLARVVLARLMGVPPWPPSLRAVCRRAHALDSSSASVYSGSVCVRLPVASSDRVHDCIGAAPRRVLIHSFLLPAELG